MASYKVTLRINADIDFTVDDATSDKDAIKHAWHQLKRRFNAGEIAFSDLQIAPEFISEAETIDVKEI